MQRVRGISRLRQVLSVPGLFHSEPLYRSDDNAGRPVTQREIVITHAYTARRDAR